MNSYQKGLHLNLMPRNNDNISFLKKRGMYMKIHKEYEILDKHTDMFDVDLSKNLLIPLENATIEVREAIEELNKKMNKNSK